MKLIGASSVLVTWDDQEVDTFSLWLHVNATTWIWENQITGTNYTFTGVPGSSKYFFYMSATIGGRSSLHTAFVTITTDCMLPDLFYEYTICLYFNSAVFRKL